MEFQKRYVDKILCCLVGILAPLLIAGTLGSSQPPGQATTASQATGPTFKLQAQRNVVVRVVIRGTHGRAVVRVRGRSGVCFRWAGSG